MAMFAVCKEDGCDRIANNSGYCYKHGGSSEGLRQIYDVEEYDNLFKDLETELGWMIDNLYMMEKDATSSELIRKYRWGIYLFETLYEKIFGKEYERRAG